MNTKIVWKPFVDYEKEERWLNEMAAQGWDLKRYTWMRYEFTAGAPGEWTYRLELLGDSPTSDKGRAYLAFMHDSGVETVSTYGRWVYFRRRSRDGEFEVFTDLDSRIAHHTRIATMFTAISAALIPSATVAINSALHNESTWMAPLLVVELLLLSVIAATALRQFRKASDLRKQRQLFE